MLTLLVGVENACWIGSYRIGLPSNVVEEVFPSLVGRGGRRGLAEEDDGDEEEGRGEEQRPEVGDQVEESRGQEDEPEESEREGDGDEEVESVLEEGCQDRHGTGSRGSSGEVFCREARRKRSERISGKF